MHYKVYSGSRVESNQVTLLETIMEPASIAQAIRVPSLKNWEWWVNEIFHH